MPWPEFNKSNNLIIQYLSESEVSLFALLEDDEGAEDSFVESLDEIILLLVSNTIILFFYVG